MDKPLSHGGLFQPFNPSTRELCLPMINLHCLNMTYLFLHLSQAPCFAMPFNRSVFSPSESPLFYCKELHSCGRHTLFMHHGFLDLQATALASPHLLSPNFIQYRPDVLHVCS